MENYTPEQLAQLEAMAQEKTALNKGREIPMYPGTPPAGMNAGMPVRSGEEYGETVEDDPMSSLAEALRNGDKEAMSIAENIYAKAEAGDEQAINDIDMLMSTMNRGGLIPEENNGMIPEYNMPKQPGSNMQAQGSTANAQGNKIMQELMAIQQQ